MKKILSFLLITLMGISLFTFAADKRPEILTIYACNKDMCSVSFLGKKYDVQIKNTSKSTIQFVGSADNATGKKIEYKQKFSTEGIVTMAEAHSIGLDNGRIFANFKTKHEGRTLDLQKKFLQDQLINKKVTIYYNVLKDKLIAQDDVVVLYSGVNLVDYLHEKKPDFENLGKKFTEIAYYVAKKSDQVFPIIDLTLGKLQVDYNYVGDKASSCSLKLFTNDNKLQSQIIDLKGLSTSGRKTIQVDMGKFYVQMLTKDASCGVSLKQLK